MLLVQQDVERLVVVMGAAKIGAQAAERYAAQEPAVPNEAAVQHPFHSDQRADSPSAPPSAMPALSYLERPQRPSSADDWIDQPDSHAVKLSLPRCCL